MAATLAPNSQFSPWPDYRPVSLPNRYEPAPIRAVDAVDFDYATELGCTIRQISRADLKDGTMFAEVGPSLVATSSPFGRVQNNQNLVLTSGKYGGDMRLGAGRRWNPTAVAVVSDLMFVAAELVCRRALSLAATVSRTQSELRFWTPWYCAFWSRTNPESSRSLRHSSRTD